LPCRLRLPTKTRKRSLRPESSTDGLAAGGVFNEGAFQNNNRAARQGGYAFSASHLCATEINPKKTLQRRIRRTCRTRGRCSNYLLANWAIRIRSETHKNLAVRPECRFHPSAPWPRCRRVGTNPEKRIQGIVSLNLRWPLCVLTFIRPNEH
jgi:hypothetical protein